MIGLATSENVSARPAGEPSGERAGLNGLYEVRSAEFRTNGAMRLQRSVSSRNGARVNVETLITLAPGHSLEAAEMGAVLRRSCRRFFEYAAFAARDVTAISRLEDSAGNPLGDCIASFRPAPRVLGLARVSLPSICPVKS
jgi:hypothetical protein